jgi:hypothetical protein
MSGIEITGSLVTREGKRGSVLYAKVCVEGEQKWIRLGKLWEGKGRPAAGYLTKSQAEVRVEAIKHGDDPIVNVQPTGAMFPEAVDAWLSDRGRECDESTLHDYKSIAKTLRAYFDGHLLDSISTEDVNAFREYLLDNGRSARTTNKILGRLSGVYELAIERGKASTNPAERRRVRRAKEGKKKLGQSSRPRGLGAG